MAATIRAKRNDFPTFTIGMADLAPFFLACLVHKMSTFQAQDICVVTVFLTPNQIADHLGMAKALHIVFMYLNFQYLLFVPQDFEKKS